MDFYLAIANKIPVFVLLVLAAAATIAGDYVGKLWSLNLKPWTFWFAFTLYALTALFYFPTLLREGLIVTSILWTVLATVGFLAVGVLIFHEHLTLLQWFGVGLGVVSVIILSW